VIIQLERGLIAPNLCPKRELKSKKKLKRALMKEKEVTYIFFLFKWG